MEETVTKAAGEREKTPFTNEHFAAFMRSMAGGPYWYGTCFYKCSESLLKSKKAHYPTHYSDSRMPQYHQNVRDKLVCADCIGAAKGYAWTNGGQTVKEAIGTDNKITSRYGSNGCPDYGANQMFEYAKQKSRPWGSISAMPEIIGLAVHKSGHVGYYLGGGEVVEWKGFSYGCVITKLHDSRWTNWYMLPFLDYGDYDPNIPVEPEEVNLGSRLLKKGMQGEDVKQLQDILLTLKFDLGSYGADGRYGAKTESAVKAFQSQQYLTQDGIYGSQTHGALMRVMGDLDCDSKDPTPDPVPEGKYVETTMDKVIIREGNGKEYGALTRVGLGRKMDYVATAEENGWYAVKINGVVGWVSNEVSALKGA